MCIRDRSKVAPSKSPSTVSSLACAMAWAGWEGCQAAPASWWQPMQVSLPTKASVSGDRSAMGAGARARNCQASPTATTSMAAVPAAIQSHREDPPRAGCSSGCSCCCAGSAGRFACLDFEGDLLRRRVTSVLAQAPLLMAREDSPDLSKRGQGQVYPRLERRGSLFASPGGEERLCLNRVLRSLHRAHLENLAGRLRLEDGGFLGEGVDALARLGGRLLDHDELGEARQHELAGLLHFLVAKGRQRFEDGLHVLLGQLKLVGNILNEFGFRHHVILTPEKGRPRSSGLTAATGHAL